MNGTEKTNIQDKYKEYYHNLSTKGNWQMQMSNATFRDSVLASPSYFARQNLLYLESVVFYHTTPPGFAVQRENFNSYQIVYTLSGQGLLSYLGKEYLLSSGSCFLIDCKKPHFYYTYSDEPWIHHGLQLNGHQMSAIFQYLLELDSIVVTLEDADVINEIHKKLKNAATSSLASADIIINQLLNDLISKILLCNQLTSDNQLSAKISYICDYLTDHYQTIRSIDEVAQSCFISKYHMCREFKKQTGKTIGTFLKEIRLREAKLLLVQTELPIAEVANKSGFESVNYFFSVFKDFEGITPLQYRKQYKPAFRFF